PTATPEYCIGDAVCGDNFDETGEGTCGLAEGSPCDPSNNECAGNMACAELEMGGNACYPPVFVKGMVFDSATTAPIGDAQVLALDDQGTAVTDIALTTSDGNYQLELPVPRQDDGAPVSNIVFTLRSASSGYQPFPGGLRT